jgi:Holliday junction resolvase RuvA-like protein
LHAEEDFGREHVERHIHLRQRKLLDAAVPKQGQSSADVELRGGVGVGRADAEEDERYGLAARGLLNLGFRKREALRVLDVIRRRHESRDGAAVATESVLREAMALLT